MAVSPKQYQQDFLISELAIEIKDQLIGMENDPNYSTKSSYSPAQTTDISFTDKHFSYISTHPAVKPKEYMANLRLKTKVMGSKH